MKKLLILSIVILIICFSSCKKANSCEKWEVRIKGYDPGCNNYYVSCNVETRTYQLLICGKDLEDAKAGRSIRMNGTCCYSIKTYVRKL